jgi:hypothetical protein
VIGKRSTKSGLRILRDSGPWSRSEIDWNSYYGKFQLSIIIRKKSLGQKRREKGNQGNAK